MSDCACISPLLNDLWHELRLYEELLLNKRSTLEDSLHRASKYMEMEEEKKVFAEIHATIGKNDEEN